MRHPWQRQVSACFLVLTYLFRELNASMPRTSKQYSAKTTLEKRKFRIQTVISYRNHKCDVRFGPPSRLLLSLVGNSLFIYRGRRVGFRLSSAWLCLSVLNFSHLSTDEKRDYARPSRNESLGPFSGPSPRCQTIGIPLQSEAAKRKQTIWAFLFTFKNPETVGAK